MKYPIYWLAVFLLLAGCDACSDFPKDELKSFVDTNFEAAIDTSWVAGGEGMVVVGVYLEKDSSIELERYFTYDNNSGVAPQLNTLFQIGSITKTFTAALLEQQHASGSIDLDLPAQTYLPDASSGLDYPVLPMSNGQEMTLAQLVSHNTGLPRNADTDPSSGTTPYLHGFNEIEDMNLLFTPGNNCYLYSNVGFGIAGLALSYQAYPSEPDYYNYFEEVLIDQLLDPLEMSDTRITLDVVQESRRARPYNSSGNESTYEMSSWPMNHAGGALFSTPLDMMKYGKAMVGKEQGVLSDSEISDLLLERNRAFRDTCSQDGTNFSFFQGLGWEIRNDLDKADGSAIARYKKGGTTNGFSASISCSSFSDNGIDYKAFVFVLANRSGFPVGDSADILQKIFELDGV